jgi:hypothetical protein
MLGVAVVVACIAGLTAPVTTHAAVARDSDSLSDPLGVYFRHDDVGRTQTALVLADCGTERWTVKTVTDDDRRELVPGVHDTTLRALRHRPTPASRPATGRVGPAETKTFRVHARLREYVREDDGDYHLVLSDRAGRRLIAEIPDPTCVGRISPVRRAIRTARAEIDARYDVTSGFKSTNRRVVVRGIGFFDYFHGQTGMAPNDLELHPVVGIRFP